MSELFAACDSNKVFTSLIDLSCDSKQCTCDEVRTMGMYMYCIYEVHYVISWN